VVGGGVVVVVEAVIEDAVVVGRLVKEVVLRGMVVPEAAVVPELAVVKDWPLAPPPDRLPPDVAAMMPSTMPQRASPAKTPIRAARIKPRGLFTALHPRGRPDSVRHLLDLESDDPVGGQVGAGGRVLTGDHPVTVDDGC